MFDNKYGSPIHMIVSRQYSNFTTSFYVSLMSVENREIVKLFYLHIHIHAFILFWDVGCWILENIVVVSKALFRELETG